MTSVASILVVAALGFALAAQEVVADLRSQAYPGLQRGSPVESLQDMNGDGIPEVLTGENLCSAPYVCTGGMTAVDPITGAWLWGASHPDPWFYHLNTQRTWQDVGDMDGDGRSDVAAMFRDSHWTSRPTEIVVFSTATNNPPPFRVLRGRSWSDSFTHFIGNIDADGDGLADLIGGSNEPNFAWIDVFDHWGNRRYRLSMPPATATPSLAKVGDVDGDGADDFAYGLYDLSSRGRVVLVSGRSGATLHTRMGTQVGDNLGHFCTGLGDIDGDRVPDFASGVLNSQVTIAYSGATGDIIYEWRSVSRNSEMGGWALLGGIDIDFDAVPDLVACAPGSVNGQNWHGRLRAYSGRDGQMLWELLSTPGFGSDTLFADSVAHIGPLPGSPYPVFAINEPLFVSQGGTGRVLHIRSSLPGASQQHGQGCASQGVAPKIGFRRTDTGLRVTTSGAPPGSIAWLSFDTSRTSYQGIHLPLPLASYGLAGCDLLVGPALVAVRIVGTAGRDRGYAAVDFAGTATAGPGNDYFAQWLFLDPASGGYATTPAQQFRMR